MTDVRIAALCDVDERLFPEAVASVEKAAGYRPDTVVDFRKLIERKDIDAVSIATPDYWHALMTIWACQAGKDVYVEKPVSFTVVEGRKSVEAARKYQRIVQSGHNMRSAAQVRAAVALLHSGQLGQVYRAKTVIVKPRGSIGRAQESSIPPGVNWDLYLGPTKYQPFHVNRFHYGWHFFWDTSTTDIGNTGVHSLDLLRWGLNQQTHPVRIHSVGGVYVWDSDQETPNVQSATFEYADRSLLEIELTNVFSPDDDRGATFYTSRGYLTSAAGGWKAAVGDFKPRSRGPEVTAAGVNERVTNASFPNASYAPVEIPAKEKTVSQFRNFIECLRSRRVEDLYCDILQGHLSASLAHLANISYRTGRKLAFDPKAERFVGDAEANRYLTREYRAPYVLPEKV
jgi:predicted dehydrogenase